MPHTSNVLLRPILVEIEVIGKLEGYGDGRYDHQIDYEVDFEGELKTVVIPEVVTYCSEIGFEPHPVVGLLHKGYRFMHRSFLVLFGRMPVVVLVAKISIPLVLVVDGV